LPPAGTNGIIIFEFFHLFDPRCFFCIINIFSRFPIEFFEKQTPGNKSINLKKTTMTAIIKKTGEIT